MGYFGFMRSGEFTAYNVSDPTVQSTDVAVDKSPSVTRIKLRRVKTDLFGHGADIFVSKTGAALCPVSAILNYLAVRPVFEISANIFC